MKKESRALNERFFKAMESGIPFVGVKLAQTLDGRIADVRGRSKWITSEEARRYGHALRSEYAGILVGAHTVQADDPELTVRLTPGRNPVRIVLDGHLRLSPGSKICNTRRAQTIVLTASSSLRKKYKKVVRLEREGVQVIGIDSRLPLSPRSILKTLYAFGIFSVLLEGGSRTIQPFMEEGLVRRVHCFIAPGILGSGVTGFSFGRLPLSRIMRLRNRTVQELSGTILVEGSVDL
jgi:diaminohydroxyphosphoribosylaminopyrimidine deaminase/5-amino-6-(5-phosphoribosylamino)uracil reductase